MRPWESVLASAGRAGGEGGARELDVSGRSGWSKGAAQGHAEFFVRIEFQFFVERARAARLAGQQHHFVGACVPRVGDRGLHDLPSEALPPVQEGIVPPWLATMYKESCVCYVLCRAQRPLDCRLAQQNIIP